MRLIFLTMPKSKTKSARGEASAGGRGRQVERVRRLLLRQGMPRLQMSLILFVTGLAGFLASYALLHAGVSRMWLRYPVAVLLAYAVFLLLLRLWLFYQQRRGRESSANFDLSGVDGASLDLSADIGGAFNDAAFGGGGDFAGAGAGGGWGAPDTGCVGAAAPESFVGGGGGSGGGGGGSGLLDGLDVGIDGDEGCLFVVALVLLIVGGLLASLYVVYLAPALLAEILVDGLLVSGLYRRVKDPVPGNWLLGAVRRTLVPVLLTLVCFIAAGYLLKYIANEAHTIREVWRSIKSD